MSWGKFINAYQLDIFQGLIQLSLWRIRKALFDNAADYRGEISNLMTAAGLLLIFGGRVFLFRWTQMGHEIHRPIFKGDYIQTQNSNKELVTVIRLSCNGV
jgi:hypothetical protein